LTKKLDIELKKLKSKYVITEIIKTINEINS